MSSSKGNRRSSSLLSDVVKQGCLYVKRPPGNKWNKFRAWYKRFFVLKDSRSEKGAELIMYSSQQDSRPPLLQLLLRDTVHIGVASESHRFPNVLVVVFNSRSPLLLAAEDELTARSWMLALDLASQNKNLKGNVILSLQTLGKVSNCPDRSLQKDPVQTNSGSAESDGSACSCAPAFVRESSIGSSSSTGEDMINFSSLPHAYSDLDDFCLDGLIPRGTVRDRFEVCFQPTEASERVGLRGNLELVVFARGLGIARRGDSECFLTWPISVIRQYRLESLPKSISNGKAKSKKLKMTLVTIEVGRRCFTGEGVFKFTSDQGREIMKKLRIAVSNWASYRARITSSSSNRIQSLPRSCNHESCKVLADPFGSHEHRSAPCTPAFAKNPLNTTMDKKRLSVISMTNRNRMLISHSSGECTKNNSKDNMDYILPIFYEKDTEESNTHNCHKLNNNEDKNNNKDDKKDECRSIKSQQKDSDLNKIACSRNAPNKMRSEEISYIEMVLTR